jgi:hypothetical protein
MFRIVASVLMLASASLLLLFAWKAWITRVRSELPQWRNALAWVALLLLSLNWCGAAILAILLFWRHDMSGVTNLTEIMLTLSRPIVLVAIVFAVALKRGARAEAVFAGLLMLVGWPFGYV